MRVDGKVEAESWSLIVSDSGPGIPSEALGKVFEPFFRLARDEYSGIEGSGLGLAICRELVIQLQGAIVLDSVVGQGTSISVRFPLKTAGTAPTAYSQWSWDMESTVPSATGSQRSVPAR